MTFKAVNLFKNFAVKTNITMSGGVSYEKQITF